MIKKLYLSLALMCSVACYADIPVGYYNSIDGLTDEQLKAALQKIVSNFIYPTTNEAYNSTYTNLRYTFQQTDLYPETNQWWDMYSNVPRYAPSFSGLNREHSFPKSWWGGLTNVPAYIDLNHLYPADAAANMAKSNYPMGEVDTSTKVDYDNGVSTVGYPVSGQGGGAKFVFEPSDEYKGDFARTYFYMVTCYSNLKWTTKYSWMLQQNDYPTLTSWAINLLLKWHREDPRSQKEYERNEAVYQIQNNRNPFIDFPELVEYIWGNKKGEKFHLENAGVVTGKPNLITPVQDMYLDFGQVAVGSTITSQLFFNGEYLTESLELLLYKDDYKMFSIPTETLSAATVNSAEGTWLQVTYKPTEVGEHKARLLISGGGIDGSRGIALMGEALPIPILSSLTALAASDITEDTYVANWEPSEDVVDYYIVNRTRYTGNSQTTEQLIAEDNRLEITEFSQSDSESYTVQSVRLGYMSPESNVVFVDHTGITGIENDQPLVIRNIGSGILVQCAQPQSDLCIFDLSGRMVMSLQQVENAQEIDVPKGVYMVVTREHSKPIKVVVK